MPVERRSETSSESLALDAALDKVAEKLRADPKAFERARAFARLRDELHLDEEEIARRVGVHKSVVSRLLALLDPDASKRIELAQQAAKEQLTVRETVKSASLQTSDAAIASAPVQRGTRATEESSSRALCSSEPSASASVETTKHVASESAVPAALRSSEPSVSAPTQVQKTATRESTSSVASPAAIVEQPKAIPAAAQSTLEDVPRWEIERRMQLAGKLNSPTLEEAIASWRTTVSSLVRGPLRDAIWELYERLTEAATWWRIIKRVLHFLARFIPGREPEPTKLQKAIKPPPSDPKSPPKKPDADPPRAA